MFEVVDTGVGIPAKGIDRIFDSFSQLDASSTRRFEGTGLGLAISRKIVGALGGQLRVESEEGKGSAFSFSTRFERQPEEIPATAPVPEVNLEELRVLVVDDNATNRRVFREQFKRWGCVPEEVSCARKALDVLLLAARSGVPFDLALVDFQMPDVDGSELARNIRSEALIREIPLILVTSVPRRGDAARMLEAGFDAYLTKPVKLAQLYNTVLTVLGLQARKPPQGDRSLVTRHTLNEAERARRRALVVEDNPMNQKVAVRMLEKAGCRCELAANGKEAVEALSRSAYDLVFMDCRMPVMDGFEATAMIRNMEGAEKHTPIIAMTANALKEDRERCLAAGMDDYITKPVMAEALKRVLETCGAGVSGVREPGTPPRGGVKIRRMQELAEGDTAMEKELIDLFISGVESRLENIESAIRHRDEETFGREVHSIKGSSANAGAERLARLARQLEAGGLEGGPGEPYRMFEELRSAFEQTRESFLGYLQRQPRG